MQASLSSRDADTGPAQSRMFAHLFQAYLECDPEMQDVIRRMAAIIVEPEVDEDDRAMALATLHEALFPAVSDRDGFLGADLEEEERSGSIDDAALAASLDAEEEAFAERVKAILHRRNMTQEQLATALGIGQPAISMLLARKARPQRRTVERVAGALGVEPGELWPGFQVDPAAER